MKSFLVYFYSLTFELILQLPGALITIVLLYTAHCLFYIFLYFLIDRDHFQLGTLSHTLNTKATGYLELSNWPEVAPDPSVRNVEIIELVS